MKNYSLILIVLILLAGSCTSKKAMEERQPEFSNTLITIEGFECIEKDKITVANKASSVIVCGNNTIQYEYGLITDPGPLSPEEEWAFSFRTVYHKKFFENRMIDAKVYPIFMDSVVVQKVRPKLAIDELLFKCDPCNATVELKFMGDTYYYPSTLGSNQIKKEGVLFKTWNDENFNYKYFKKGDESAGLYVNPKNNSFRKKPTFTFRVVEGNDQLLTKIRAKSLD